MEGMLMPVTGADTIAKNIKSFGKGFKEHVRKTMDRAGGMLDADITENMSLGDHTLADLAAMGHPYALRHGPKGIQIHDPYWLIHTHTGRLLGSKSRGVSEVGIVGGNLKVNAWVKLDEAMAPYALGIIWGTSRMIPRDVLSGSLFNKDFQARAKDYIQRNLRDMVINFRGLETR